MTNGEIQLFKSLCNFKSDAIDAKLFNHATPAVLGHLFLNRMQAIAYGFMKERGLLVNVNREFRNALKSAYEQNIVKNLSYFWCVNYLAEVLSKCECKYAMLKGAYLCRYYPEGYRTSNDVDVLVMPENVTKLGNALTEAGFVQGHIRNDNFIPATRKEIIESKMMRGETVPYVKRIDMPGMKFLEVDINFSLDYKNSDTDSLGEILNRSVARRVGDLNVPTLDIADFFIHLCSHLYKEATTLPWIEMKRDMTLYKYCDIYLLLYDMSDEEVDCVFERAMSLGMEDICAFAILQTAALFDVNNSYAKLMARGTLCTIPDFLHTVVSPKDNQVFIYIEEDISKRFFAENRADMLKEV